MSADNELDGDACLSVDAVRAFAVREFVEAPPLAVLGTFMLPVEGRAEAVPVLGSGMWQ